MIVLFVLFIFVALYKESQKLKFEKSCVFVVQFDCRKDATLLNNVTLQIVDFIVTILYPPKFWRFLSMLYEKYELTKKVGDASICLRRSVMRRMRGLR